MTHTTQSGTNPAAPEVESYPELVLSALWTSKTERETVREADYIETAFELDRPGHILDVPCGNGRIALEMARRKHHVTGIDRAESAIALARAEAKAQDLTARTTFQTGDMRELPWAAEFDGAYCFWESFGYFDDAGNRAFLEAVARTLKPGAKFVLDTHLVETILSGINQRHWIKLDNGMIVLEWREYDHLTSRVLRHWTVVDGDQHVEALLTIQLYTYRELVALLEESGFTACEGYSWLSIIPFMLGAARAVMVATRV